MSDNPYHEAWCCQCRIIEMERNIQELQDIKKELENDFKDAIARGEATGRDQIDGYTCVTERKTTEKRTIKMDLLKKTCPEIIFNTGVINAGLATGYMRPAMKNMMLNDPNFDKGYKIGLGELENALGGKKNSAEFCDVDIKEDIKKRITRMAPDPIIEV